MLTFYIFSIAQAISNRTFCFVAVLYFSWELTYVYGTLKSAQRLFFYTLVNIFKVPMSFYYVTPIGRILARFSQDVDAVDNDLRKTFKKWMADSFLVRSL